MHPGRPTVNIQCVDQMFGDKDDLDSREDAASSPRDDTGSLGAAGKSRRSQRKSKPTSSVRTSTLTDGYIWRKYGQRNIHGAKPRSYYRCIYKPDQGCTATRQVQATDEDPHLFNITYYGVHSCVDPSVFPFPTSSSFPGSSCVTTSDGQQVTYAPTTSSFPGSSCVTTSDDQQDVFWMNFGVGDNSSDSESDQILYGRRPQDEYKEETPAKEG